MIETESDIQTLGPTGSAHEAVSISHEIIEQANAELVCKQCDGIVELSDLGSRVSPNFKNRWNLSSYYISSGGPENNRLSITSSISTSKRILFAKELGTDYHDEILHDLYLKVPSSPNSRNLKLSPRSSVRTSEYSFIPRIERHSTFTSSLRLSLEENILDEDTAETQKPSQRHDILDNTSQHVPHEVSTPKALMESSSRSLPIILGRYETEAKSSAEDNDFHVYGDEQNRMLPSIGLISKENGTRNRISPTVWKGDEESHEVNTFSLSEVQFMEDSHDQPVSAFEECDTSARSEPETPKRHKGKEISRSIWPCTQNLEQDANIVPLHTRPYQNIRQRHHCLCSSRNTRAAVEMIGTSIISSSESVRETQRSSIVNQEHGRVESASDLALPNNIQSLPPKPDLDTAVPSHDMTRVRSKSFRSAAKLKMHELKSRTSLNFQESLQKAKRKCAPCQRIIGQIASLGDRALNLRNLAPSTQGYRALGSLPPDGLEKKTEGAGPSSIQQTATAPSHSTMAERGRRDTPILFEGQELIMYNNHLQTLRDLHLDRNRAGHTILQFRLDNVDVQVRDLHPSSFNPMF